MIWADMHPTRLRLVYGVVFIAFLDNFAMLPTVGPYARGLGADPAGVGAAVAAYSVTNLVFNLVGGLLLDRAGRKRLAVAGLAVAAVAVAGYTLAGTPGLDIQRITHVKVIDVVGSIDPDYASHDSHGNKVNDPWPTPFHTGGFDLDAIGVIHATGSETGGPWIQQGLEVRIHHSHISLLTSQDGPIHLEVYDMQGRRIFSHREALAPAGNHLISLHDKGLLPGVYVLRLQAGNQHHGQRFFYNGMR